MSSEAIEHAPSEVRSPAALLRQPRLHLRCFDLLGIHLPFPLYWTVTTSFKAAVNVTQGHLIPWVDFQPDWRGWRSLGLSPDTIGTTSTVRDEFLKRFTNSVITSLGASTLAIIIGSLAAYGLTRFRYKFGVDEE